MDSVDININVSGTIRTNGIEVRFESVPYERYRQILEFISGGVSTTVDCQTAKNVSALTDNSVMNDQTQADNNSEQNDESEEQTDGNAAKMNLLKSAVDSLRSLIRPNDCKDAMIKYFEDVINNPEKYTWQWLTSREFWKVVDVFGKYKSASFGTYMTFITWGNFLKKDYPNCYSYYLPVVIAAPKVDGEGNNDSIDGTNGDKKASSVLDALETIPGEDECPINTETVGLKAFGDVSTLSGAEHAYKEIKAIFEENDPSTTKWEYMSVENFISRFHTLGAFSRYEVAYVLGMLELGGATRRKGSGMSAMYLCPEGGENVSVR